MAISSLNDYIPKGNYRSIVLQFDFTNASGKTIAITDLGRLRITRNGADICNIDVSSLADINNAEAGYVKFASTTSSNGTCQVRYNFFEMNDKINCLRAGNQDTQFNFNFSPTLVGSSLLSVGILTVYAVVGKGIETYLPGWYDASQNLPDVSGTLNLQLPFPNISKLYFKTASDFSNIQVTKDAYSLFNASAVALLNATEFENQIEGAVTFIYLRLNPTGAVAEQVSKQIQILLISNKSGGGASTISYQQILFNPAKTQESIASYQTFKTKQLGTNVQAQAVTNIVKGVPVAVQNIVAS